MPDHVHGIVVIEPASVAEPKGATLAAGSLGAMVGQFKSMTAKRINADRETPGRPVWQRNHHERIIRDARALERIRRYITDNPRMWSARHPPVAPHRRSCFVITMQTAFPPAGGVELDAALLQAAITAALAALCAFLYHRHRKVYFAWWAAAWSLYLLRVGAIASFVTTANWIWLYWHQVVTGWTALTLLWTALAFSGQLRWRRAYLLLVLFPPLWSYVAIYRLDHFLWAAGPAVLFLSAATLWTAWVFHRYARRVGSTGARLLAGAFFLWGLHHLDYPFLRARGAWIPWGYYLDICFELAVGAGIVLLVLDDLRRGLGALLALSGDLQRSRNERDVLDALLTRLLILPSVRGSALYLRGGAPGDEGRFAGGAGSAAGWAGSVPSGAAAATIARAVEAGRPETAAGWPDGGPTRTARDGTTPDAYAAVLPVYRGPTVSGALVLVGDARDPFTALDDSFLVALGQQVGTALERADLYQRLEARTEELARLSTRMLAQHEEERRRLSRELHDETAQVFSAVKMELGVLRESVEAPLAERLDHTLALVDTGIRSIRNVVNDLRPSLLDDLGLVPALRSLATGVGERSGIAVTLDVPATVPPLSKDAELALFRAVQEALSNVVRHAGAQAVAIRLAVAAGGLGLVIADDGRGLPEGGDIGRFEREGHMGLAGMRERIQALGGSVRLTANSTGGVRLDIELPLPVAPAGSAT